MSGMMAEEEVRLECERQRAAASHSRDERISNRVGLELTIARRSQMQAPHKRPQPALDRSGVSELTAGPWWGGRPIRWGSKALRRPWALVAQGSRDVLQATEQHKQGHEEHEALTAATPRPRRYWAWPNIVPASSVRQACTRPRRSAS